MAYSQDTTRRALLKGLPAASAAMVLPQLAEASHSDPVVRHYKEWLAARRDWRALSNMPGNEDFDHPASRAAEAREDQAERGMLAQPPSSAEGVAALVALSWFYNYPGHSDVGCAEYAGDMALEPLLSIWRACTGKEEVPVT
ncbi:hypothetical protein [Salipiger profundus]|uniref:hypothetical protein n=1 Tax=Salipiger profundus TaxID=1229727 RepID=UPI0008F2E9AE|nr:hypothetical protein [Salipiger profundus]SFD16827.1 hypothetical protein SAMN05444415_10830 [Salipiger profundus]